MQEKRYTSYDQYLGLMQVLGASDFVGADSDQLNFVISHQVTELLAKLLIRYLTDFTRTANLEDLLAAESVSRQLNCIWDIFEHISVNNFLRFRESLKGVSGAESQQFRQLASLLPECKRLCQSNKSKQGLNTLARLDSNLRKWKAAHLYLTEKLIGSLPGTGGSSGASYLKEKSNDPLISHEDLHSAQQAVNSSQ